MPSVIDWNTAVDPSELVQRTSDALAAGSAAVLPGESGYLALWRPGTSVTLSGAALLAFGPDEVAALGLSVPKVARRLMFRAWPAPLVVEIAANANVPAAVNGLVRLRFPDHPLFDSVIPAVKELGPVLVADLDAATAHDAAAQLGAAAGLVVNAGERRASARPTVVRCTDTGYDVVESGAFAKDEIDRFAARVVLFVCTGNTCRSPLAESLAKKLLSDRLKCTPDELPARGFWLLSAGVATYAGSPASEESCVVAAEFGADLSGHTSRPVNPQLLMAADDVLAMTRGHLVALEARYPNTAPAARLLCGDEDLDDPIGAGLDVYRECARTLVGHLERIIPEWVAS